MTTIILSPKNHSWNSEKKVFTMSERDVSFDTSYEVVNQKTNGRMEFYFSHSTGPEFSPDTRWVYHNKDKSISLEVCNDPRMTRVAAENYLKYKTR